MKSPLAVLLLIALPLLIGGASRVAAEIPNTQVVFKKRVSLELTDVPLRKALEKLFEGTSLPVVVDPNVPDPKVTAKWTDRTVVEVFDALVKQASSQKVRLASGIGTEAALVMVNPNTPEEEKQFLGAGRKVKLSLKDVPMRRAMDLIFVGSGLQYSIHPAALKLPVTVELNEVHIELALALLESAVSKSTPVAVTKEGDVYAVRVAP